MKHFFKKWLKATKLQKNFPIVNTQNDIQLADSILEGQGALEDR